MKNRIDTQITGSIHTTRLTKERGSIRITTLINVE